MKRLQSLNETVIYVKVVLEALIREKHVRIGGYGMVAEGDEI